MKFQLTAEEIARYNQRRPAAAHGSVCHAPSRSLYFGMRGEVMVCCANRSHLAGRYPAQSIRECWTSAQNLRVREALTRGDMSQGCQGCYDLIRAGNYSQMPGHFYDHIPPHPDGWPRRMDFELTNTCNLECVMCRGELSSSIRRNREQLPPIPSPYDDAFLDQLEEFLPHLSQSYFAGGEPFLIGQYLEIWDRMAVLNPGHHLSVQTNGTILSDRIKRLLERLRVSIALSIDSVHGDRLEAIRVNAQWDKVRAHLDWFLDYARRKGTLVTVSYTPMTLNWMEFPDAIRFCNGLGIKIFFNNLSYPRHLAFSSLPAEELAEIVAFLQRADLPAGNAVERANRTAYLDLVAQIDYWRREAEQKAAGNTPAEVLRGEAWFEALRAHVDKEIGREAGVPLYEEVSGKLRAVFAHAIGQGQEEALWAHMATVDFAMLCTYIPGKTEAELLTAFRTAVMQG